MRRIAVVDDATEFLRFAEERLDEEGYGTVLWAGGDGPLAHEDSGLRILEATRLDPRTAAMPVIVHTTDATFLREQGGGCGDCAARCNPSPSPSTS